MSSNIRTTHSPNTENAEDIEISEHDEYININCEQHGTLIKICVVLATTLIIAIISVFLIIAHIPLYPSNTKDTFSRNTHYVDKKSEFSGKNVGNKTSGLIGSTSIENDKTFFNEGDCCKFLYLDHYREQFVMNGRYRKKSKFNGRVLYKSERFDNNIAWTKEFWAIGGNPNKRKNWETLISTCSAFCIEDCSSKDLKGLGVNVYCKRNLSNDVNPCSDDRPLLIAGSDVGQISGSNYYPNTSSNDFMCEWRISGRFGYIIKITILGLNLNEEILFIMDGEDASAPVIGGFTASTDDTPEPMFSSGLKFGKNESKIHTRTDLYI